MNQLQQLNESTSFIVTGEDIESRGVQSEITLGFYEDRPAIRKIANWSLTEDEARSVIKGIRKYRSLIDNASIPQPVNFHTGVLRTEGGYTIDIMDEYIDHPTLDLLIEDRGLFEHAYKSWIDLIGTSIKAMEKGILIDLKPDNFIYHPDYGKNLYIDVLPPLTENEGVIENYYHTMYGDRDPKHMLYNFGTIEGQMTKLLAVERLIRPEEISEFLTDLTLHELEGRIPNEKLVYIREQAVHGFPDQGYFYTSVSDEQKSIHLDELLKKAGR